MIRKHIVVLVFVLLASNAHANLKKDTSRIAVGAGIGAAGFAALQATFNAARSFVEQDSSLFPGIDYQFVRLGSVVGGAIGLWDTTYMRTWRAHCNMACAKSNQSLINITMDYYESDAALVRALENYCVGCTYPLPAAQRELAYTLGFLNDAACLIEQALEDIDQDSLRAQGLNDWLDEIRTVCDRVAYAINTLNKDPRIFALIDAQNRLDQTNALWADAIAQVAIAASNLALARA